MSNFTGHAAAGAAVSIATGVAMVCFKDRFPEFKPLIRTIPLVCAGIMFGSLYPDTDIKSKSGMICNAVLLVAGLIGIWLLKNLYILGVMAGMILVPMFSRHRKITHTVLFNLITVIYIWFLISPYLAAGCFVGALCHLILDRVRL